MSHLNYKLPTWRSRKSAVYQLAIPQARYSAEEVER